MKTCKHVLKCVFTSFFSNYILVVCQQQGVFRINCIDCLDRTNVVQTAIAKSVLETQLLKLGLIPPEHGIPDDLRLVFQNLWANNGDALSRQYAGTNALKGDFTRTGERNLHGLMKDGKHIHISQRSRNF